MKQLLIIFLLLVFILSESIFAQTSHKTSLPNENQSLTAQNDSMVLNHIPKIVTSGIHYDFGGILINHPPKLEESNVSPDEEERPVTVLPDPFTPNGDGFNDYAVFIFSEDDNLNPVIQIFNLRGKQICELGVHAGNIYQWDGKDSNGNDVEPDVYIYIFKPGDNQASNGTITLIR